jgi:hypothetical protein
MNAILLLGRRTPEFHPHPAADGVRPVGIRFENMLVFVSKIPIFFDAPGTRTTLPSGMRTDDEYPV